MQINIINITNEEIDYLLAKLGIRRHLGGLYHDKSRQDVGEIDAYVMTIDFDKLKKLELVRL